MSVLAGWFFAYRIDQYWIKTYNKLADHEDELVKKYNTLAHGYNELLDIHMILIDYLKTSDPDISNIPDTSNKKRILN